MDSDSKGTINIADFGNGMLKYGCDSKELPSVYFDWNYLFDENNGRISFYLCVDCFFSRNAGRKSFLLCVKHASTTASAPLISIHAARRPICTRTPHHRRTQMALDRTIGAPRLIECRNPSAPHNPRTRSAFPPCPRRLTYLLLRRITHSSSALEMSRPK